MWSAALEKRPVRNTKAADPLVWDSAALEVPVDEWTHVTGGLQGERAETGVALMASSWRLPKAEA